MRCCHVTLACVGTLIPVQVHLALEYVHLVGFALAYSTVAEIMILVVHIFIILIL